jgi:hypothetical protein
VRSSAATERVTCKRIGSTTTAETQTGMGQQSDQALGHCLSGIVFLDSRSMIHNRPQRTGLLEKHTPMMATRNLCAPQPPRFQLVGFVRDLALPGAEDDDEIVKLSSMSSSEQYETRRQCREKTFKRSARSSSMTINPRITKRYSYHNTHLLAS